MIYFERVNFAYEVRGLASENKNLDLSNRAQLKKKEFIDSLKNEQEIVRLDI
jgi:hypothetical protein